MPPILYLGQVHHSLFFAKSDWKESNNRSASRMSELGQKQSFGNVRAKGRFGVKSGSLRKADLLDW